MLGGQTLNSDKSLRISQRGDIDKISRYLYFFMEQKVGIKTLNQRL